MWDDIEKYLPEFQSAVLTGLGPDGYPYSLRCRPVLDVAGQRLRVPRLPDKSMQVGAAGLLYHSHDEHLWNLKSFVLRGTLDEGPEGWEFIPEQFIPGMGIGGWRSYIHFVRHGRAATRAFFAKRDQPIPRVAWGELLGLLGA